MLSRRLEIAGHHPELVIEIFGEDPALPHVAVDRTPANCFGLAVVHRHGSVVALLVGAVAGVGDFGRLCDARIHRLDLDGFDEALGHQSHDVGLEGELERRLLDRLQKRKQAIRGLRTGVDERLDREVQVRVADEIHRNRDGSGCDACFRRDDDDEVVRVDTGVGFGGGEHRLKQDEEAAAVVGADGQVQVDVGSQHHFGQGVMDLREEGVVVGAVFDPQGVQADGLRERSDERQHIDDGSRIGRQLRDVDRGREHRRRGEEERERNVLGQGTAGIRERMPPDKRTERITGVARRSRTGQLVIDLLPDFEADGSGLGKAVIITTRVQRGGEIEERLARFKGDGRASGLRLSDPGDGRVAGGGRGIRVGRGA